MQAYFDLRASLENAFGQSDDWNRFVIRESSLDGAGMVLSGRSPRAIWSDILWALAEAGTLDELESYVRRAGKPHLVDKIIEFKHVVENGAVRRAMHSDLLMELPVVAFSEGDLEPGDLGELLHLGHAAPPSLISAVINQESLTEDEFDDALSGVRTLDAKRQSWGIQKRNLNIFTELKNKKSNIADSIRQLKSDINSITHATEPRPPIEPMKSQSSFETAGSASNKTADELYQQRLGKYRRELDSYKAKLTAYRNEQARLPELNDRLQTEQRALHDINVHIEDAGLQSERDYHDYAELIAKARDSDINAIVGTLLNQAEEEVQKRGNPFAALQTLLAAAACVDIGYNFVSNPLLGKEILRDFDSRADDLARALAEHLPAIARDGLSGPAALKLTKTRNEQHFDNLKDRLNGLPLADFQSHRKRFEKLAEKALPQIPSYNTLEIAEEIREAATQLEKAKAATMCIQEQVQSALDEVSDGTLASARAGRMDVKKIVAKIKARTEAATPLFELSGKLLRLLNYGASTAPVPSAITNLCAALRKKAEELIDTPVEEFVNTSAPQFFKVSDVENFVKQHPTTYFLSTLNSSQNLLTNVSIHLELSQSAIEDISTQIQKVYYKYRKTLNVTIVLSIIPIVGVFSYVYFLFIYSRINSLAKGDVPEYTRLKRFAFKVSVWCTSCVLSVSGIVMWIVLSGRIPQTLLDFTQTDDGQTFNVLATSLCGAGDFHVVCNLGIILTGAVKQRATAN